MYFSNYSPSYGTSGFSGGSGSSGGNLAIAGLTINEAPQSMVTGKAGTSPSSFGVLDGIQASLTVAGFVPGLGEVTNGASAIISLFQGDWTGAGLSAVALIPFAGDFADAAKLARLGKKGSGAAEIVARAGCFSAGTEVSTPEGEKRIQDIKVGTEVYAYDLKHKKLVSSRVSEIYRHSTTEWNDLVFMGGDIIHATPEHRFWNDTGKCWIDAAHLKAGTLVFLENGREEKLLENTLRHLDVPETTYNFNVDNEHDYFVGRSQILVHNVCVDALSAAARVADRGGLTVAGRSLTKHGLGARPGNVLFPPAIGSPSAINQLAHDAVDDILTDPGTIFRNGFRGRFGTTLEATAPDGRGLVFGPNGDFLFFKE